MRNAYSRIVIAAFGISLIAAGRVPQESNHNQGINPSNSIAKHTGAASDTRQEKPAPLAPDYACSRGRDNRHSDLCAQWKAADAAFDAARWGWWQLLVGALGLIFGAATMAAAIAAALYAKRAAVATERSVKIAEDAAEDAGEALAIANRNADSAADQVRVSEETAARQLRAYVGLERVYVQGVAVGQIPSAVLDVRNFGQTPAYNYDVFSFAMLGPKLLDEESFKLPDQLNATESTLAPGGLGHAYPKLPLAWTDDVEQAFRAGQLTIHVFGEIRYNDAFGISRVTRFRVYHDATCAGSVTHHHAIGNEQT